MNPNYLPLAYLNAWEYCPRRFYWEYVLGEMADNEHIITGRHLHRNVNQPGQYWDGDTLIYRHGQKDNPLKIRKQAITEQQNLNQVRGMEGLAAREYFEHWSAMLKDKWTFSGRHRRPPTDPVNALLGFAYGLLRVQVTAAVHMAGLDPYIGYLHETTRGQPAMVLDLMEEFRPLVADNLILSVLNHKQLKSTDFNESLGAYRLSDSGRTTFLQAFECKMNTEFKHPTFGYRCTYRRAIELQARLLARHLQEGVAYQPLILR